MNVGDNLSPRGQPFHRIYRYGHHYSLFYIIGGFDERTDETILYRSFICFGPIREVFIPRDRTIEGSHRGFGFVEYEEAEDAKAAIDNMHMNELPDGQVISCNMARPTLISTGGVHTAPVWELQNASAENIEDKEIVEEDKGDTDEEKE